MKIAIIGAGFSGVACAWHLLEAFPTAKITVFDANGIGGGASGVSAGLLNHYAGLHAKLNPQGVEGTAATSELLKVAEKALGRPVAEYTGLLRLATVGEQVKDYQLTASRYSDVEWLSEAQCLEKIPGIKSKGGIFVHSAITVNSNVYLEGLWKACEAKGAAFQKQHIHQLSELDGFDKIIVAMGAFCSTLPELSMIPNPKVKGQILRLAWPKDLPMPSIPINSNAYLIPEKATNTCLVGATFERDYVNELPDIETAKKELMPKVADFFPALAEAAILDCKAGMRASTPTHLPLIKQVTDKCFVITGMGSKGLLYHALYAKKLCQLI